MVERRLAELKMDWLVLIWGARKCFNSANQPYIILIQLRAAIKLEASPQ